MSILPGSKSPRQRTPDTKPLTPEPGRQHPVEVKTSYDQNEEEHHEVRRLDCWRHLMLYILILSVTIAVVTIFLIFFLVVYPMFQDEKNPTSAPYNHDSTSEFRYLPTPVKQHKFNYSVAINKELINYYQDIRKKHDSEYLKRYFNYQQTQMKNVHNKEDLLEFLSDLNSNRLMFYVSELKTSKNLPLELKDFDQFFGLTEELNDWYNYLHDLKLHLSSYEIQKIRSEYDEKIGVHNIEKYVTRDQTDPLEFDFDQQKIKEINQIVSDVTKPTEVERSVSSIVFRNKIICLSEALEELKDSSFQNIYVLASKNIYLDVDLKLPEANLVLISPVWTFKKTVTIDLSGKNGSQYAPVAKEGENGKAGNPGGNGGNFLGVGGMDKTRLFVHSRGGNGSNGQNGADGSNGTDGGSPDLKESNPTCIKETYKIKNSAGEVITQYEVYDKKGCGANGTDGGVAGIGGRGGNVVLVDSAKDAKVVTSGENGVNGGPGRGGKRGFGGSRACYYVGIRIKQNWSAISKVKCGANVMPSGVPGRDNANSRGQSLPRQKSELTEFGDALLKFRIYAYSQYDEEVRTFLQTLDEDPFFVKLVPPTSFFKEMKLINQNGKTPFYESLAKRTELYLKITDNHEYKKTLKQLQVFAFSKTTNLKYGSDNCLVVDLEAYLKSILDNIHKVDRETLQSVDHARPILKDLLQKKLNEIDRAIERENERLDAHFEKVTQKVEEYCKKSGIMNVEQSQQTLFFGNLAQYLDARKILYLNKIVRNVTRSLVQIGTNRLLDQQAFTESYQLMRNIVEDYQRQRNFNLQSSLKLIGLPNVTYEEAMNEIQRKTLMEPRIDWNQNKHILYLSQILIDYDEFRSHLKILERSARFSLVISQKFRKAESRLIEEVKSLAKADPSDLQKHVEALRNLMFVITNSYRLRNSEMRVVRGVGEKLEHLETVLLFVESYSQRNYLSKLLDDLETSGNYLISDPALYDASASLKHHLYTALIVSQYKHAINAFRQWIFPYGHKFDDLMPSDGNVTLEEATDNLRRLISRIQEFKSTVSSFDKNIRQAMFTTTSPVGEFYVWHNGQIRTEIENLFRGKKVTLRADVENMHILNKNAIKFRTLRLEFRQRGSHDEELAKYLSNFAIEMKHSGYSYYQYRGETFIITSDEVTLYFSYELDKNGLPQIYNQVYKKLETGDIALSPYTTWTVQLQQTNIAADYSKLVHFADNVDIVLVGSGSYVAESDDDETYTLLDRSYRPIFREQML